VRQTGRQGKVNGLLAPRELEKLCAPEEQATALLKQAIARLNLSARAYHRVLKVARTIADLAGEETIGVTQMAEAIQYRRMDRAS
jgi:magnesium chelatase family protein